MATEVKQPNKRLLVPLGIVVTVAAFGLSLYVSRSNSGGGSTGTSTPTTAVVAAKVSVAKGIAITPDMLTTVSIPQGQVPATAVIDPATVVGKYTAVPLSPNQTITTNELAPDAATANATAIQTPVLDLAPGDVAIAIPAGEGGFDHAGSADLVSVAGYIVPDDHIDIIGDPGNGTLRYLFQDVRVLRVGISGSASTGLPSVYVVEASRAQAVLFAELFAKHSADPTHSPYHMQYVLRSHADYGTIKDPKTGATRPCSGCNPLDTGPIVGPSKSDNAITPDVFKQLFGAR